MPHLQLDLELQTKLDNWKEYYYDQRRTYQWCEKSVRRRRRKVEYEKERERKRMEMEGPRVAREEFWWRDDVAKAESWLRGAEEDLRMTTEYLKWMERQLPIIASECAESNNVRQAVGIMNHNANVIQNEDKTPQHELPPHVVRQLTPRSALSPVHTSRVSKVGKKKSSYKQARRFSRRISSRLDKQTLNGEQEYDTTAQSRPRPVIPHRSSRISKRPASDPERSFLSPSHSSKVSKPSRGNPSRAPQHPRVILGDSLSHKRRIGEQKVSHATSPAVLDLLKHRSFIEFTLRRSERIAQRKRPSELPPAAIAPRRLTLSVGRDKR